MDKKYYSNLVIRQYSDKPKAIQTIQLDVDDNCKLVNGVFNQFINAFDIEKAEGKQLDIIGSYVGQSRNFKVTFNYDLFAYVNTDGTIQENGVGYSSPNEWQEGIYVDNSFLQQATYTATDDIYKYFIKLKIARNKGRFTDFSISNIIYKIFDGTIIFIDNRNMSIQYLLTFFTNNNIRKILEENKYLLPAPAGVVINLITTIKTQFAFGYADPDGIKSVYATGYSSPEEWQNGTYILPSDII